MTDAEKLIGAGFYLGYPLLQFGINQRFGQDFKQDGRWFYREYLSEKYGRTFLGHNGVDATCPTGTPVYATHAGRVTAFNQANGFLALTSAPIAALGPSRAVQTYSGHLDRAVVEVGQYVRAGQLLAYSDNRGDSTGPHLHFHPCVVSLKPNGDPLERLNTGNGYDGAFDPEPLLAPWGNLARAVGSPDVYLIQGLSKRLVTDPLAFFGTGASFEQACILEVQPDELGRLMDGKPLDWGYTPLNPRQVKEYTEVLRDDREETSRIYAKYF